MTLKADQLAQIVGADGTVVPVPDRVLNALKEFAKERRNGTVTLEIKDGAVNIVKTAYVYR